MKRILPFLKLLFWLALCQLPALAGARAVQANLGWYHALALPPFTPPDALFGLAWGVLYVLLGTAAFLAFGRGLSPSARKPLILFIVQLALNAWWTPVFFGRHDPAASLLILALMLAEGVWLAYAFWRKNRAAAWLLLPYGLWLIYAAYLNIGVWALNA